MLKSLHIENIAVIKTLDLDLAAGFSALTGETGAGKSVIIDSIGLLLGAKAERELIRTGETSAMVSGVFYVPDTARGALADVGINPDEDACLMVQRTMGTDGRSAVKINGRAATLAVLRAVTPHLIAIHGQSDTHALADPAVQLRMLDTYAGADGLLETYRALYREYEDVSRAIRELTQNERNRERLSEILAYQIRDIESASLREGEEEELIDRKLKLKSSERIRKNAGFAYKALRGSEKGSVAYLLDRSATALGQLADVIPACDGFAQRLRDCLYQVEDIAEEAFALADEVDTGEDINDIEARLDRIGKLKRKYGATVGEVLAFLARTKAEYETLTNADDRLKAMESSRRDIYGRANEVADRLHALRAEAAGRLESTVKETLDFLDMPKVVFFTSMKEEYAAGERVLLPDGTDKVEFYISANRGADPQPLAKIASGGEQARIMLALKCALSDKDGISTLIFDEIDAGVSGKTARKIGIKMLSLASLTQVITVTHSAQIASLADAHYLISKADRDGATCTEISLLDEEGRVREISRILGGLSVTDAQRAAATDMLREREKYRSHRI